jgi:hypothetical protein
MDEVGDCPRRKLIDGQIPGAIRACQEGRDRSRGRGDSAKRGGMMRKRSLYVALTLACGALILVGVDLLVASNSSISCASPLEQAYNPCGAGFQIDITPRFPTHSDAISVTYSAVWRDSCAPLHQSHQVLDGVIKLDAAWHIPTGPCAAVLTDWGGGASVGGLAAGIWRVEVYLAAETSPTVSAPQFCGSQSFVVFGELHPMYLPVVIKKAIPTP